MKTPQNCIICKGLFQETLKQVDEEYCFVSIDVDLYRTTLDALKYFYPRLLQGGYLFIHDYNDDELYGVKQAIGTYQNEISESLHIVPLCDHCGTLVISK